MREAVGGSLLLYLIIPIIILFIVFIGFIMNYASAYRAANYVITQIENCQGQMNNCGDVDLDAITETVRTKYGYINRNKAKIVPCYINNGNNSYVFRVELPVAFDLPIFGTTTWMKVRAETKTINNVPAGYLNKFSRCV